MTKTIDTLADDIKGLFGGQKEAADATISEEALAKFGAAAALSVSDAMRERTAGRKPNTLYMSEIGQPCMRKLWYSVHYPTLGETMQGHTLFKFLYGNLIEETALLLAEAAGHTVEGRQSMVTYKFDGWTIRGRQDAVIDGVMVDVKGVSPFGYKKFKEGLSDYNDDFGYRTQLSGYNGLLSPNYSEQGFLAIDKQNGHVGYFETPYEPVLPQIAKAVRAVKEEKEPPRQFDLIPDGKSGNKKLGVACSYCPFKYVCWRNANGGRGLRTFAYSYGPVFLGTVVNEPRVVELVAPTVYVGRNVPLNKPPEAHPIPMKKDALDEGAST